MASNKIEEEVQDLLKELSFWQQRSRDLAAEVVRLEGSLKREKSLRTKSRGSISTADLSNKSSRRGAATPNTTECGEVQGDRDNVDKKAIENVLQTSSATLDMDQENARERARIWSMVQELLPKDRTQGKGISLPALVKGYTTWNDVARVEELCRRVNAHCWESIFESFFATVTRACERRPAHLRRRDAQLSETWYLEPWYCAYVQYFGGTNSEEAAATNCDKGPSTESGTFDDVVAMLPHLQQLRIRNLLLLAHYESPLGDEGYDVSEYAPRRSLGGRAAYERLLLAAHTAGIRIGTDAILNHTSTQHSWFRTALDGSSSKHRNYYAQCNGREKIDELQCEGDVISVYRDPDGSNTKLVCNVPDVDRTHGLWARINGQTYQFFRSFYPFTVDLNLRHPELLSELFELVASELQDGVLAKRADAFAHWMKDDDAELDSSALLMLLKSLMRHVSPRAVLIPEVVRSSQQLVKFAGEDVLVAGVRGSSGADLLYAFDVQAAMREMCVLRNVASFWRSVLNLPAIPDGSDWIQLLEHHDELFLGFYERDLRQWMTEHVQRCGGLTFKNGLSAGLRLADLLGNDEERIAAAIFALYMVPGVPMLYYGLDIGSPSNHELQSNVERRRKIFAALGTTCANSALLDPRDLQRGNIARESFEDAWRRGYPGLGLIAKLNKLREQHSPLRSRKINPVDSGHLSVLCLIREGDVGHKPLLCCVNLSDEPLTCTLQAWRVLNNLNVGNDADIVMEELLSGDVLRLMRDEAGFKLQLAPYQRMILQLHAVDLEPQQAAAQQKPK